LINGEEGETDAEGKHHKSKYDREDLYKKVRNNATSKTDKLAELNE
jgi:hypothetical protein